MINTESGLITAAFHKKGSLELKPESFKETKNIDGSFEHEDSDMAGWREGTTLNFLMGKGGYQKVYIDKKQGASGTKRSLAMDFKLGSERVEHFKNYFIRASIGNLLQRDIGNYSGIKFYIKAWKDLTITFALQDIEKDSHKEEFWFRRMSVTQEWMEIHIPFNSLILDSFTAKRLGTDRILDLRNINGIFWSVREMSVALGTEGTIWLDEVAFY
jgi:hypothetical protein